MSRINWKYTCYSIKTVQCLHSSYTEWQPFKTCIISHLSSFDFSELWEWKSLDLVLIVCVCVCVCMCVCVSVCVCVCVVLCVHTCACMSVWMHVSESIYMYTRVCKCPTVIRITDFYRIINILVVLFFYLLSSSVVVFNETNQRITTKHTHTHTNKWYLMSPLRSCRKMYCESRFG